MVGIRGQHLGDGLSVSIVQLDDARGSILLAAGCSTAIAAGCLPLRPGWHAGKGPQAVSDGAVSGAATCDTPHLLIRTVGTWVCASSAEAHQRLPARLSAMSRSLGCPLVDRMRAYMATTKPGVQKPH